MATFASQRRTARSKHRWRHLSIGLLNAAMENEPDYYAMFLNALAGLIDDAELQRWDQDGVAHLREATDYFRSDYRMRQHARDQSDGADSAAPVARQT